MSFVEDLSVFFQPDAPGIVPAYYNGSATPVYGHFEVTYFDEMGNLSEDRQYTFSCPAAELPAAVDDTLVIAGTTYTVFSAAPDLAVTNIILKKQ